MAPSLQSTRARVTIDPDTCESIGSGRTGREPMWWTRSVQSWRHTRDLESVVSLRAPGMGWGVSNTTSFCAGSKPKRIVTLSRVGRVKQCRCNLLGSGCINRVKLMAMPLQDVKSKGRGEVCATSPQTPPTPAEISPGFGYLERWTESSSRKAKPASPAATNAYQRIARPWGPARFRRDPPIAARPA